jgi:glycosyltransferase involved in cell wall biosynthesis
MIIQEVADAKILLTTPDYPPKMGGLSTFTVNIEKVLESLGLAYDLFVWKDISELKKKSQNWKSYQWQLNVHFMASHFLPVIAEKQINFIHGSEILFTSPHLIKRFIKRVFKPFFLHTLEKANWNIFVSEFSQNKLFDQGFSPDYSRDLVFHNCIDLGLSSFKQVSLANSGRIKLIAVTRDVPHKNMVGHFKFAQELAKTSGHVVELYVTTSQLSSKGSVEVINIDKIGEAEKEKLFQKAHFNLLFSLDHSSKGFFEGFGLTILEAGKWGLPSIVFNQGGTREAVHDHYSGYVFEKTSTTQVAKWWQELDEERYQSLRQNCFTHTHQSHGLTHYETLFKSLMSMERGGFL